MLFDFILSSTGNNAQAARRYHTNRMQVKRWRDRVCVKFSSVTSETLYQSSFYSMVFSHASAWGLEIGAVSETFWPVFLWDWSSALDWQYALVGLGQPLATGYEGPLWTALTAHLMSSPSDWTVGSTFCVKILAYSLFFAVLRMGRPHDGHHHGSKPVPGAWDDSYNSGDLFRRRPFLFER